MLLLHVHLVIAFKFALLKIGKLDIFHVVIYMVAGEQFIRENEILE